METNNDYNFSLFKPKTKYGKKNRNLIVTLVVIWFVAIFGFQALLLIFQKPTPEKALTTFESVWDNVKNVNATDAQKQDFIKSLLSVEGKSTLKKENKAILDSSITWVVFGMISDSTEVTLAADVKELKSTRKKLDSADNEEYTRLQNVLAEKKVSINSILDEKIGIKSTDVEAALLPYCLTSECKELSENCKTKLPVIMKLYLTHNQSFLTDTKFLGFPFHYFYTAEFLLFLFVFLCLIYSFGILRIQKKCGIVEN